MALLDSILFNLLNLASGFLFTTLQAVYNIIDGDLYIEGNNIRLQPSKLMRYFQSLLSTSHSFFVLQPLRLAIIQSSAAPLPVLPVPPVPPVLPVLPLLSVQGVLRVSARASD